MTAQRPLIIGTRGSALALWQAHHIAERLLALGQSDLRCRGRFVRGLLRNNYAYTGQEYESKKH